MIDAAVPDSGEADEPKALVEATLEHDAPRATTILSEHILPTLDGIRHTPSVFSVPGKR